MSLKIIKELVKGDIGPKEAIAYLFSENRNAEHEKPQVIVPEVIVPEVIVPETKEKKDPSPLELRIIDKYLTNELIMKEGARILVEDMHSRISTYFTANGLIVSQERVEELLEDIEIGCVKGMFYLGYKIKA